MPALNPPPAVPTGPLHSFQALSYPLPADVQARLKQLSLAIFEAPKDAKQAAMTALDDYTTALRTVFGSELCRREFVYPSHRRRNARCYRSSPPASR